MRIPRAKSRAVVFPQRSSWSYHARLLLAAVGLAFAASGVGQLSAREKDAPLVIHEWGTFTSLQNSKGEAIGGINSDDEPVPQFVHRLGHLLLLGSEVPPSFCQGAPHCHPDVTMRLETPVIYFHPPKGKPLVKGIDVLATFKGGWLTEYYPNADTDTNANVFGPLRSGSSSTLAWKDLQLGGDWAGPQTQDHVWTAPRGVQAASVRAAGGESERFLFYRGVAHLDAPLAISPDPKTGEVLLRGQLPPELGDTQNLKIKSLWLAHIRADGRVAFRGIPGVTLGAGEKILAKVSTEFGAREYRTENREGLKASLLAALLDEGLFRDEAQGLLNTWELSYFKSSGWRVFFLVPRAWTDFYLPLKISVPSEITRVMVGRIELISQEQKDALRQIASFSEDRIKAEAKTLREIFYSKDALTSRENRAVFEGKKPLEALGISIPRSYALYLGLGRFRDALLLDEQKNHPSTALERFIYYYHLEAHNPQTSRVAAAARAPSQ